jgi:hypothetical protein
MSNGLIATRHFLPDVFFQQALVALAGFGTNARLEGLQPLIEILIQSNPGAIDFALSPPSARLVLGARVDARQIVAALKEASVLSSELIEDRVV